MPVYKFDKFNLFYQTYGKGNTALLFIHGLGGHGNVWKYQAEHFKDKFFVVTVDLFGHGKSSKDVDPVFISELDARAIVSLMRNKIKKPYFAIGHSFAGDVIPEIIRQKDNFLRGVVFVDCAYHQSDDIIKARMSFASLMLSVPEERLQAETEKWYFDMLTSESQHPETEFILSSLKQCDSRWLFKSVIGCHDRERVHPHSTTPIRDKLPILVVEAEYGIGTDLNKSWVNHYKNAEYYLFEKAFHFFFVTERQKFNAILERFIAAHS